MSKLWTLIQNRKKPILGAIAFAITYVAAKAGLDIDAELSASLAGVMFAIVAERVSPIFGVDVDGPKVEVAPSGEKQIIVTAPAPTPAADPNPPEIVVETEGPPAAISTRRRRR